MTEDKNAENNLQRLNLVLRTIRNVDRVILEEKDRRRLLRRICDSLVATRGYYNAWIALMDKSGKFTIFAEAGLGKQFLWLIKQLKKYGPSMCGRQALDEPKAVVISDPASYCIDCPLAEGYAGRGGITTRLQYRERIYGLLCASVPVSFVEKEEEHTLFEDIAADIAFALYKIELEKEHEQTEEELRRSESRYRNLFDCASDGMLVRDLDGNIIIANGAMKKLTGYSICELNGMNISKFLTPASLEIAKKKQAGQLKDRRGATPQRYELQMVRKDGTERTIEVVTSLLGHVRDNAIIQEIARDITEIKRSHENLREYASRVTLAQEEERRRIARELHDETAQALTSLGMDIDSLARDKGQSSKQLSSDLERLRDRVENILRGVRSMSHALRIPVLEEFGLLHALKSQIDELNSHHGMNISFNVQGTTRRLPSEVELALFRVAQEALNNIWKHAQVTRCHLELKFTSCRVRLELSDDGQGFNLPRLASEYRYSGKLGITGMYERARLIGGTLRIRSKPGLGTTITLEAPY